MTAPHTLAYFTESKMLSLGRHTTILCINKKEILPIKRIQCLSLKNFLYSLSFFRLDLDFHHMFSMFID